MTVTICLTQNCNKKPQQTTTIFAKKTLISLSIITIIFFVVKTSYVLLNGS